MSSRPFFEVVEPGLETCVQELPGRIGHWEQGFPPSGPADAWSFRLANLLVGNDRDAAALECQFLGPSLRFLADGVIAMTGAEMMPRLDGAAVALWQSLPVRAGQVLATGGGRTGARMYIAFAGGIDTPKVLGSRATFHMAGVGGVEGFAIKAGQVLPVGETAGPVMAQQILPAMRPPIETGKIVSVEVVAGPNDDWLGDAGAAGFLAANWTVLAQSNRTGMRLKGPSIAFAPRAYDKLPEHGQDPANILDHGYPVGGINIAGQTPIILLQDAPSTGGFINPFTVPSAALWKLGQIRPGQQIRFTPVTLDDAHEMRRRQDLICTASQALGPL
ncbi:biotin-dependent carboxyltransferase [Acidisoma cellulosilytica]|uniref:Biotin-dependent carboxyltransferase n=1 Tax=Acidisoma cellulosilyticum TaxID=2802395 RepID=A0A963Z2G2_9PROT|nr:biotin-dependent carboxyltransferase family protein [Acidisoma cellulosilyticum]MCB8881304.1 biotin-dependent carboxyltransferase [Acidisoma cellulosilyticum]